MLTNDEIESFSTFVKGLTLTYDHNPEEYLYHSPVLICLNAVLSINRRYQAFAAPRIRRFRDEYPTVQTLGALDRLLTHVGYDGLGEVWHYRDPGRARLLQEVVRWFRNLTTSNGAQSELDAMRVWAAEFDVTESKSLPLHGIEFTTTQYLRMLIGASTTKPVRHLHRAIQQAVHRKVSDVDAVLIVERAAERLGVHAIAVDYALWKRFSQVSVDGDS